MSLFTIGEQDFLLDGQPHRILAGALHYFRVHPDQWADRIRKARQMGLNTIETYVAWNLHAPSEDVFDLSGGLDLGRFLDLVAAEGMHAIVRPGPYICAEWDNGGLPGWLFSKGNPVIRSSDPVYMKLVRRYLEQLAPVLVPRQIDAGGPIILIQIENEYGAYGSDVDYLEQLVELNREIGLTVPFTTVDQPEPDMLENGSLPTLHKTGSFGSRAKERLATLRQHQPTGPLMCSEFWVGWFDHWGAHHHTTNVQQSAHELEAILAAGASVNVYMFHGGTNFGFTNGANDKGVYQPTVTSYDYDAPLDESGHPTEKYWAFREILGRYTELDHQDVPAALHPGHAFEVSLCQEIPLWNYLDATAAWWQSQDPASTDDVGHFSGFSVYRSEIETVERSVLAFDEVRDRAQVFLNREHIGTLSRDQRECALVLPAGASGTLEILVEDQGRVNYGDRLGEAKGLIGQARINGVRHSGWELSPVLLSDVSELAGALAALPETKAQALAGPVFARGTFDHPDESDLFLDTHDWTHGIVWINGFCLGRYNVRGPQRTLYIPGPLLTARGNEIIVLEQQAATRAVASFVAEHDLGHTEF
ncbi:beta-galactosidase [Arthrobacter alpinus]|uniref:glycoside hydrolase family 35 protein n=1 Tax=Arthrobacter alpinus TaxID=656366 RepID=UPI0005CA018A|nr:beta-galactosidase family protein [Arthrobacter alpinus]ALV46748.1 beta-galactosidase [Arthrobacter alpinus]